MATRKKDAKVREDRRAEERAALASASSAYTSGLDLIAKATASLARGSRALESARRASVSPSLAQYGVAARLRPAVLQRLVLSISKDLETKLRHARNTEIVVPDGEEKPYERFLARLSAVSSSLASALSDFEKELPERSGAAPAPVRDLIVSSARAATHLNRTIGRSRSSASVHVAAVSDEISTSKDVSFY